MKVVPLKHRHTLIQGDVMEPEVKQFMHGNTKITILPPVGTKEEQDLAEYQMHLAAWDLCDSVEEDEAV